MTASSTGEALTVRLTIPARAEYITLCRLALTGIGRLRELSDELLADLKLALTEAASNSVRHAYAENQGAGVVEISYVLFPDRLVIEVTDEGEGFESVEDWRLAHERFFERPITPDTQVVAVRFRVVERVGR